MSPAWKKVAAALLADAADEFARHGCNDWRWPAGWSPADRRKLATALVADNVQRPPGRFTDADREHVESLVTGDFGPPDWWLMRFLAKNLGGGK